MNHNSKNSKLTGIVVFLFLMVVGIYFGGEKGKSSSLVNLNLNSLLATANEVFHLNERVKESDCLVRGHNPDPDCTPGSVFTDATPEIICVSGYTKTVRNVSVKLKRTVYENYGLNPRPEFGTYEMDHLIPLGLGGNNDIANLFPEAGSPAPGFREKDIVENYLRQEVCAGRISLYLAQIQIANDWLAVYQAMSTEQISILKNKYKSWAGNP